MRVHAGYMICQNDIPSNSSVGGHILIFTVMMFVRLYPLNSYTKESMIGLQK